MGLRLLFLIVGMALSLSGNWAFSSPCQSFYEALNDPILTQEHPGLTVVNVGRFSRSWAKAASTIEREASKKELVQVLSDLSGRTPFEEVMWMLHEVSENIPLTQKLHILIRKISNTRTDSVEFSAALRRGEPMDFGEMGQMDYLFFRTLSDFLYMENGPTGNLLTAILYSSRLTQWPTLWNSRLRDYWNAHEEFRNKINYILAQPLPSWADKIQSVEHEIAVALR